MRILGIDPGLERIGVGVIDKHGSKLTCVHHSLIQTPRIDLPSRLALIGQAFEEIVKTYQPDCVATERLLFAANKTTAMDVSKSLGVILYGVAKAGLPWCEYSPPEIKLAVVGNGNADKKQVIFMVTRILALAEPPKPDDVADALAIALCHGFRGAIPK